MSSYKSTILIFSLIGIAVFLAFCFSLYKIFDSEYRTGNCKSLKISIEAITENPEMLLFVSDQLKTKRMGKNAVKKLSFLIRYCLHRFKNSKDSRIV